ncbi:hypothetical protein PFLUV_G00151680 [Perca fluviatilis]|uniref:Uncharacterized protein n=1 Tax=Perca fluviatilis TaxID=8168 RepID=A0A6A5EJX5_PERFL|nr:hypothetical protein PFLUV_G00151680 [Perca fluviatilis]
MLLDQQEMEQESGTNLKNLFRGSGRSPGIRNLKFPPSIEDLQDYQRGIGNLWVCEVKEAAEAHRPGDDGFVISIREHKTNKSFGVAQMFLETYEFRWLVRWLQLRVASKPPNQLVFFTAGKGRPHAKTSCTTCR